MSGGCSHVGRGLCLVKDGGGDAGEQMLCGEGESPTQVNYPTILPPTKCAQAFLCAQTTDVRGCKCGIRHRQR